MKKAWAGADLERQKTVGTHGGSVKEAWTGADLSGKRPAQTYGAAQVREKRMGEGYVSDIYCRR